MIFLPTQLPDVIQIRPCVHEDDRGYFMEVYQKKTFSEAGIPFEFVQDNHSSSKQYVLRGLHYQVNHTQGKLIRVVVGEIFDVAVDLRKSSPNFGRWVGVSLSAENKTLLWIPPGFAHGFFTQSEIADVFYKTTDYFEPAGERCIRWDDPNLAISWPIPENERPIVSKKDQAGSFLKDAEVFD